ncbi:MAG: hypothetical protein O2960_07455 [Verrucomicrobia bacterium]|nr:hypothetical protein [Verrucomicrobiota bacterium]
MKWLAVALWGITKGDTARISDAEGEGASMPLDWQAVWGNIYHTNSRAESESPMTKTADLSHYTLPNAGDWVQTLLDPDSFWRDINGWALHWTLEEFDALNAPEFSKPRTEWPSIWQPAQAEHHCRRFHAYQRARYRYHEYMLEKHCERALGTHAPGSPTGHIPATPSETRACLIGWLSKQRGFAKHSLVEKFRQALRRKRNPLSLVEKKAFHAERQFPSKRPWRANPDEVGWLILTWPVWNFYRWRWSDVAFAVHWKFRSAGDNNRELRPISSHSNSPDKEDKDASGLDANSKEGFRELLLRHCYDIEAYRSWERLHRKQSGGDKAIVQICRRTIGLEIIERPVGSPNRQLETNEPSLWDFAPLISV